MKFVDIEHFETIGARVGRLRRYRGMSQQQLGDLAGLSQGFISLVERGERELERRRDIAAIADALRVSPVDLTSDSTAGVSSRHNAAARAAVPDVRRVLMATSSDDVDRDSTRPLRQLAADAYSAAELEIHHRDWVGLGRVLPDLILDAHATMQSSKTSERDAARQVATLVGTTTSSWLKEIGYIDLAWIAGERAVRIASEVEDPLWLAMATFNFAARYISQGDLRQAGRAAHAAAEATTRETDEQMQMYGMLCLTQALSASSTGDGDADAALAEARSVAEHTGEGNAFGLAFGPTNIRLWELAIALEQGEPDHASVIAAGIEPGRIENTERRAAYHRDRGLALARIRLDQEATEQIRTAEDLDPTRTRNHPLVRDAVAAMRARARREAGGRDLRGLAHRMGMP